MEKFSLAVSGLAAHQGSLQERLGEVYAHHLLRLDMVDRLPAARREKFRALEAAMSVRQDPVRGSVAASAGLLTDDAARDFAEYIVSTAFELHRGWWMENGGA